MFFQFFFFILFFSFIFFVTFHISSSNNLINSKHFFLWNDEVKDHHVIYDFKISLYPSRKFYRVIYRVRYKFDACNVLFVNVSLILLLLLILFCFVVFLLKFYIPSREIFVSIWLTYSLFIRYVVSSSIEVMSDIWHEIKCWTSIRLRGSLAF